MHMKFVEAQDVVLSGQLVERDANGIARRLVAVHAVMQAGKEVVEVPAQFRWVGHPLKKAVE